MSQSIARSDGITPMLFQEGKAQFFMPVVPLKLMLQHRHDRGIGDRSTRVHVCPIFHSSFFSADLYLLFMPHRITLLGVPIDAVSPRQALDRLLSLLVSGGQYHVMTPNNEMLVQAASLPAFHLLLRRITLNLPDSTGLVLGARLTGQVLPHRVTGVDTMRALCTELSSAHPIFLLGAKPGIAEKTAEVLRAGNPSLVVAGTYSGSPKPEDAAEIIARINQSGAHILFVAFGAPGQDLWIDRYRTELTQVRLAMGVGGSFDFFAGAQKRAPGWLRKLGLEWVWRLVREPTRYKRIWQAVAVFPYLVLRYGKKIPTTK